MPWHDPKRMRRLQILHRKVATDDNDGLPHYQSRQ